MSELMLRIAPWCRDVVLAYAGGLVLGAPVAAVATYATGIERLTTWCLLGAMALVLWALRHQRAHPAGQPVVASAPLAGTASGEARHAA